MERFQPRYTTGILASYQNFKDNSTLTVISSRDILIREVHDKVYLISSSGIADFKIFCKLPYNDTIKWFHIGGGQLKHAMFGEDIMFSFVDWVLSLSLLVDLERFS